MSQDTDDHDDHSDNPYRPRTPGMASPTSRTGQAVAASALCRKIADAVGRLAQNQKERSRAMSQDTDDHDDHSDNPYRPRKLNVRDPLHDLQLLRDMAIINARVRAELGPLPPGGLPVEPKRKPTRQQHLPDAASAPHLPEDDPMKLQHLAATAIMPLALTAAGCSKGIARSAARSAAPARYGHHQCAGARRAWAAATWRIAGGTQA
ncbi:hypothetical protein [Xanthomonas sp. MUS 060]|uniref:hypothetical protein n=1 Tax=Xanthomonas sp. MUS 060 TaxID=1588031 RepID=UPI000A4691DE|nr:hypothetical protein [Xanthomonas sp. MUS 060]